MQGSLLQSTFWSLSLGSGISGAAVQREPQLIRPAPAVPISLDNIPQTQRYDPALSANTSSLLLNAPDVGDVFDISCNGSRFGYIKDSEDCVSASSTFARTARIITFSKRDNPGITPQMYPLPWRWMGGQADCFFQPVLKLHAETGSANLVRMRDAARYLIETCAEPLGQGGVIRNVGIDNSVALIMGNYGPGGQAVQCGERKANTNECYEILFAMPVGGRAELFGPRGDPEADVQLPYRISSWSRHQLLVVFSGT
ncbi:MAG: hypothetical protein Q9172_004060 [Xanthocarpia lactea]